MQNIFIKIFLLMVAHLEPTVCVCVYVCAYLYGSVCVCMMYIHFDIETIVSGRTQNMLHLRCVFLE